MSERDFSDDTKIGAFNWGEFKRYAMKQDWFETSNIKKDLDIQQQNLVRDLIQWEKNKEEIKEDPEELKTDEDE